MFSVEQDSCGLDGLIHAFSVGTPTAVPGSMQ